MDIVAQVMQKVNNVFHKENLEKIARDTGFIQRVRKVIPEEFLKNMLLVNLDSPSSSLEDLAYEFYKNNGCVISKQALHKKIKQPATAFMEKILNELLSYGFTSSSTSLSTIPFVRNINVIDSSEIRLNKNLANVFPQVRNQGAAVKLQSLVEVVKNQVLALEIRPSKEPDQGYKDHLAYLQAADLLIGDLGYFCVNTFKQLVEKNAFFLSRYFKKTSLREINTKELIDLRAKLSHTSEETVEYLIELGTSQFPCRLVAIRLPEEAYQKRIRNLKEKRRKDARAKENDNDVLNQWTILVTNLPLSVDARILLHLYSLRWQIELFFKMAKTFMKLKEMREKTNREEALLCLYIKLIAIVLLSLVTMTLSDREVSLYKVSKIFLKHFREFIGCIGSEKICAVSRPRSYLQRFGIKESRAKRPSTQLLLGWRPIYA